MVEVLETLRKKSRVVGQDHQDLLFLLFLTCPRRKSRPLTMFMCLLCDQLRRIQLCQLTVGAYMHVWVKVVMPMKAPQKDLTAINNRLNKRLGRLEFKGTLIRDSVVAGSLYPCTRSGNHHSVRLTTDSVLRGHPQASGRMVAPLPPSPMERRRAER
ncbi:unnamed protein product [Calypogeia fissa]